VIHAEVSLANFGVLLAIVRQILHFQGGEEIRHTMVHRPKTAARTMLATESPA
jgi:hypothetical protein